ncbi:hypothetical protein tinsulaeT_14100 [Thalassotalea insulae]|uniref:Solute-binding protein family 3/N-terminal domain-containing protein n=1 Tax=Thalassotalea insulae TaxID=2056778 RepID=A0ABQ6GUB3_9GAMM|nr:transporter substrate-binding domain-containing protein [Thalassotalea insulae]GLX78070.1 hypothetical protein tinsulaeT_14100 [Thalassotalea insulae]
MKLLFIFVNISWATSVFSNDKLVVALSSFEPWTIINEQQISGIDIELLERLAQMQKLTLDYYSCPWARCLQLLKEGKIDIVSSIFYSDERAEYLSYFNQPYVHGNYQVFYLNKASNFGINSFSDLNNLEIGVRRDISYFPKFDQNQQLNKKQVTYDHQLVNMLLNQRIDTFVGQEDVIDYLLIKEGHSDKFIKANYKVFQPDNSFLAFSKKSKLLPLQAQMERNLAILLAQDMIGQLRKKYQ